MLIITKILLILFILLVIPSYAFEIPNDEERRNTIAELKKLSLEELSDVEVFNPQAQLASRKVQKLSDTAAALFVISQEDIRRSGITSIPEALRMVPGVQVARINANQWAISARGLNEQFSSKLLVMIDGRTVYSPLRSQVNWDVQDTLIEDVERIEVIRGPGASLWGANAVNGIINIITKSAKQTQGNLATSYFGKGEEGAIVGVRHGGQFGDRGHYRIYGKFLQHDNFVDAQGQDGNDDWQMKRAGFRIDWEHNHGDALTLQGDMYKGIAEQKIPIPGPVFRTINTQKELRGFNILARWQRNLTNGDFILQSYFDLNQRRELIFDTFNSVYDLDFQHRWQLNNRHEFLWGLGFRYVYNNIKDASYIITYTPEKRYDRLFSAFVQNEFSFETEDWEALRLIIGSKFEHNDYTGFEIQPTIRLLWNLNDKHNLWAAVSRAVRTPTPTDSDILVNVETPGVQLLAQGNPNLKSEVLIAYELGYRFNLAQQFLFDASLFYNDYHKLRTREQVYFRPFPPPATITYQLDNQMTGEIYGLELAIHHQVTKAWKLIGTYSYLNTQLHLNSTSSDTESELVEGNSPEHQASLRSLLTLPHNLELDTAWYYVGKLSNQDVRNYHRFDIRLGWQPEKNFAMSLGVRNIGDSQHREFGNKGIGEEILFSDEIPRALYFQLKSQF